MGKRNLILFSWLLSLTCNIWSVTPCLDTCFGNQGTTITASGSQDFAAGAVLQCDNKVILAGMSTSSDGKLNNVVLIRYKLNGHLDKKFGNNGVVVAWTAHDPSLFIASLAIQKNGKILIGGCAQDNFFVARFNTNGSIDTTFGQNGRVITKMVDGGVIESISLQKDGKIVAAGLINISSTKSIMGAARYLPNGTLDSTFGTNGIARIPQAFASYFGTTSSPALQSDGKIIIIASNLELNQMLLARLTKNGHLDTSFGANGITRINVPNQTPSGLFIHADNKITIMGTPVSSGTKIVVAQMTTNGQLDSSFGNNGVVMTDLGIGAVGNVVWVKKGKTYVAGGVFYAGKNSQFATLRYNADGTLDSTFGIDGVVYTKIGANSFASGLVFQCNKNLIEVGTTDNQFVALRYTKKCPKKDATRTVISPTQKAAIMMHLMKGYKKH